MNNKLIVEILKIIIEYFYSFDYTKHGTDTVVIKFNNDNEGLPPKLFVDLAKLENKYDIVVRLKDFTTISIKYISVIEELNK